MHRMSLKPSKANVEVKGKVVLYPVMPGTVFLELSAAHLSTAQAKQCWELWSSLPFELMLDRKLAP